MIKIKFDEYLKAGIYKQEDDIAVIKRLITTLINNLYKVDQEHILYLDLERCHDYKVDDQEPVNWADLSVVEVIKDRDSNNYLVTIEEAAPDACPSLCSYITTYMKLWGWNCEVKTEW